MRSFLLWVIAGLTFFSNLSGQAVDAVVSKDGSGDFMTIQEAIDAAPENGSTPYLIYIRNGIYDEKLYIEKDYITLLGEDRDSTRIKTAELRRIWRETHESDWGAATINIKSGVENLTLANLTVLNNFADENPDVSNPNDHTFAIRGGGHRVIILNCNIISTGGDTLSLWNTSGGMYYHNDCYFEGYVDFVCPRGYCYITDSKFYGYNNNASIWHDGSGGVGQKLVIQSSEFNGVKDFALGRYHKDASFYLLNCNFSDSMRNLGIRFVGSASDYKWGKRVYYHQCEKKGGTFGWYADNLQDASRSPHPRHIDASWTFYRLWDPESEIDSLLPMASVPHPINKELWVSKNAMLTWVPGRNVIRHALFLGTDPDSLAYMGSTERSLFFPGILEDTLSYYWRVDEITVQDTVMGKTWQFTTHLEALPAAVWEPWPPDEAILNETPVLSWTYDPASVDSFLVYLGDTPDQLQFMGVQTDASFQPQSIEGETYFWRVDAKNDYGVSEGAVWSFKYLDHAGIRSFDRPQYSLRQLFVSEGPGDWLLEFKVGDPGEFKILLYDIHGRLKHSFDKGYCSSGTHFVSEDELFRNTGQLKEGFYICSLVSGYHREHIKLYIP